MADNQNNTRGGSSEQHAKAGSQSHKNQSGSQDSNMRGGSAEQHAEAGRKGGEAKAQSNQGGHSGGRGFAGMDKDQQREISSKGGKAAHASGHANEFNSDKAREAGRKGGNR